MTGREVLSRLRALRHFPAVTDSGELALQGDLQPWLADQVREHGAEIVYLLARDEVRHAEGARRALLEKIITDRTADGMAAWWECGFLTIDSPIIGRIVVTVDERTEVPDDLRALPCYTLAEAAELEEMPEARIRAAHRLKVAFRGRIQRRQGART